MLYPMTEKALAIIAQRLSESIVIRSYDAVGNSCDVRRKPSDDEKKILYRVLYASLVSINYCARHSADMQQAIKDTAEFTLHQFIPGINAYDSAYCKLWAILDAWNDCMTDKKIAHWVYTGIRNFFPEEMDYISNWLDYPQEELSTLASREEAQVQIDGMMQDADPDDMLPEALQDPDIMMLLWNVYVRTA
jgi:hypothetical protein